VGVRTPSSPVREREREKEREGEKERETERGRERERDVKYGIDFFSLLLTMAAL
jgi:hypothetical protein